MESTGWFTAATEPVREGVYRRQSPAGPFSCWAQGQWYGDAATPETAAKQRSPSKHQAMAWSGLTTPPDTPCLLCRGHGVIDFGIDAESGEDLIDPCPEC